MFLTLHVLYVQFANILGKIPCWGNCSCTPACPLNVTLSFPATEFTFVLPEFIQKYILCICSFVCTGISNLMCTVTKFCLEFAGTHENNHLLSYV
jgi:hypothetical protein